MYIHIVIIIYYNMYIHKISRYNANPNWFTLQKVGQNQALNEAPTGKRGAKISTAKRKPNFTKNATKTASFTKKLEKKTNLAFFQLFHVILSLCCP